MIFKIDFEKVYDSLAWYYLFTIMDLMGFSSKWINWIKACLSTNISSILIYKSPTIEFSIRCDLRQGDPLSSFTIILAMERLHVAWKDASGFWFSAWNWFRWWWVAFNAFVLCRWCYLHKRVVQDILNIISILWCFHSVFGLQINLLKSNLFGVGVLEMGVNYLVILAGYKVSKQSFVYLGL